MIATALSVAMFAVALFFSLILLQTLIEISNTGRDTQPNTTYTMTWLCVFFWSVFFMLQTTK